MSDITSVRQEMWFGLFGPDGHAVPIRAKWSYQRDDPFAVTVLFTCEGASVSWTFSRELLIEGTIQRAGLGDLQIWPVADGADPDVSGARIHMEFMNPTGYALVAGPRSGLLAFLKRTLDLVAAGHESEYQDIDSTITAIFSEAA